MKSSSEPTFFPEMAKECVRIGKLNTLPVEIQLGAMYFAELMNYLHTQHFVAEEGALPIIIQVNNVRYRFNPNLPPQSFAIIFRYI